MSKSEIISDSLYSKFENGITVNPIGKSHPIRIIIPPIYIIISAIIEKTSVAMGATIENPPKLKVVIAIVELIANMEDKIDNFIYFAICLDLSFESVLFLLYSPKTMIPSVANAESHNDMS